MTKQQTVHFRYVASLSGEKNGRTMVRPFRTPTLMFFTSDGHRGQNIELSDAQAKRFENMTYRQQKVYVRLLYGAKLTYSQGKTKHDC
jgi:hypothetical protein